MKRSVESVDYTVQRVVVTPSKEIKVPDNLREQLDQHRAAASKRLPADVVAAFDQTIEDRLEEGVPPDVIKVGDTLEPFTLEDATGKPVTLESLVETGPAVIVFYRGGWCPYCNLALRAYQREVLPKLSGVGGRLVAISPQTPDQSLSTAEKAQLEFTVLSDPGSRVAWRIGIAFQEADEVLEAQRKLGLDLRQVNAEGSIDLPRPTVLIVDTDRTVRFVDVQPDFTARTEVADILAALAEIARDDA
jgi:peroxiredoxin